MSGASEMLLIILQKTGISDDPAGGEEIVR